MSKLNSILILFNAILLVTCTPKEKVNDEWIQLFNGKDLSNWRWSERDGSFKVVDSIIVVNGERSHLFYIGDGKDSVDFRNFELTMDVKTHHLANSGVYIRTAFQQEGWPERGYEVQVNGSHKGGGDYKEVKKGGSLYGIRNLYKAYAPDSIWYNLNIRVQGNRIQVRMNNQLVTDYTEPLLPFRKGKGRLLSDGGTIALQGHDPLSTVHYKNIKIKLLPDSQGEMPDQEVFEKILDYQSRDMAFIDQHVSTDNSFNIDSAMNEFYKTGINLGLIVDVTPVEKGKQNEKFLEHVDKYSPYPVFLAILRNNLVQLDEMPSTTISKLDYIITEVTQVTNEKGEITDIIKNQNVGNKAAFMNDYVKTIVETFDRGKSDIWGTATLLPESLSSEYDKLWTTERMTKVIEAAKRNKVAIEVNNQKRIPSIAFLKLAKEKGCLFSCGGLFRENKMSEPDYFYEVIDQCKLGYKDIFIPGNM